MCYFSFNLILAYFFDQIGARRIQSIQWKIEVYLAIFWNKLDALAILLFVIACILRVIPGSGCFCTARIVLAVDLSIWYIRTLDLFSAVKRLGPKLVMIGEMVKRISPTCFPHLFLLSKSRFKIFCFSW